MDTTTGIYAGASTEGMGDGAMRRDGTKCVVVEKNKRSSAHNMQIMDRITPHPPE